MLPKRKVMIKPTRIPVDACSFQTTGIGTTRIITSVTMLGKLPQTNKASALMQWAACSAAVPQCAEKG